MADIHPGSFVGDSIEEFKKLPTAGKIGIGALVLLVAGIALYERSKAASTASSPITGAAASGVYSGSQLPAMDTSGGSSASSGSPTPTPTPTPTPVNNGLLGPLVKIWQGGATGQPGQYRWWFQAPGGKQTLLNPQLYQNSSIVYGGQGRVWEKTADGQQILLTSGSTPQPAQTQGGTGGGPDGANLFATVPAMSAPSMPSLATHTMQPGETISGIAARLGVTVNALQAANATKSIQNGTVLTIPGR